MSHTPQHRWLSPCNAAQTKLNTEESTVCDSIHVIFKNQTRLKERYSCDMGGFRYTGRGQGLLLTGIDGGWGDFLSISLPVCLVTWVCSLYKNQSVNLWFVHFWMYGLLLISSKKLNLDNFKIVVCWDCFWRQSFIMWILEYFCFWYFHDTCRLSIPS